MIDIILELGMAINEEHILQTYNLALNAQAKGNHPFGALLVLDSTVVLTAENTVFTDHDITRHAELNLVSMASKELDQDSVNRCVLYTSTEPCAMCTGAIYWSGISHIVYGCSAALLGEIAGGDFLIPCRDLFQFGTREIKVIGPILEDKGAEIHRNFW
jgi:tRNA(Arg) A34 adenosine deaminase TadA